MKIHSLEILDYPPIKNVTMENLGDVVIIAGANGVGKTKLKEAIVQAFQGSPLINLKIQATNATEKNELQDEFVELSKTQRNQNFSKYINSRSFKGEEFSSCLVQIDSERDIKKTTYPRVNHQISDPDDKGISSSFYHKNIEHRWQDFVRHIHEKVAAYNVKIAEMVQSSPKLTGEEILEKNPHPLEKYKNIFKKLLPEKDLQEINPVSPKEFQYKCAGGTLLPFSSLSSGEQEIIKIVFDLARKDIRDSIIVFDEPELHLHPTLTFRLVEMLKTLGDGTNQFIFLTHSADLISTYYATGDVYFIDQAKTGGNQAHKLDELNHTHHELVRVMGENLGLFAVGKKLIFVEGKSSSVDRLAYHLIAQKYFPEANIIPIGSVENIITLNAIEAQIRSSIFGIDFYMIRDRDALSDEQIEALEKNGRIKCLKKRHIENYFLDSGILFKVVERLCLTAKNPVLTEDFIKGELKRICKENKSHYFLQSIKTFLDINSRLKIPTVKSPEKKSIADVGKEMIDSIKLSLEKQMSLETIKKWIEEEANVLEADKNERDWSEKCHGKIIFAKLCGDILKTDPLQVRKAYIDIALNEDPSIFSDIVKIFESFKSCNSNTVDRASCKVEGLNAVTLKDIRQDVGV